MAGIDRSDSIRRPVDSTLSTRTAHRGGESTLQPQREAMAQLRQSAPAIAVVIEQHDLGTPRKPLFELLLSMNDQWVRVQSTKPFQPGTVLLIEATGDDQIRVLPNPEPAQLNRMMQASLQFWQAHTLPKVHATALPPLPTIAAQQQLVGEQPELKPLIDWLNQRPTLNARSVANWVREFMPLAKPLATAGNATAQQPGSLAAGMQNSAQPVITNSTSLLNPIGNNGDNKSGDKAATSPNSTAPAQNASPKPSSPLTTAPTPLRALAEAIRVSLPLVQQQPLRWLPLQQQPGGQWQPLHPPGSTQPFTLVANTETLAKIAAGVAPSTPAPASTTAAQPSAPIPTIATVPSPTTSAAAQVPAEIQSLLRIQPIDALALQQPQRLTTLVNKVINQSLTPALSSAPLALQPSSSGELKITVTPTLPTASSAGAPATPSASPLATATQPGSVATIRFAVSVTTATDIAAPGSVSMPATTTTENAASSWRPLPARPGTTDQPPLEIRLAQWLLMIDNRIRQHPASLQQSLAQRAQQLLRSNDLNYGLDKPLPPPPLPQLHNSAAGNPASQQSATELQPLLQLRNWLEAVQGKTQNNAIQQTLSALAQGGDGPNQPVQQLSIPLIWMGPSSWANLEWWQEQASDAEEATGAGGKRLWRFRLFFELEPLAPLCADLVWEPQQTDLTFWSEDRSTLAFLNSHLGTLEQWTEGLGERQLHTRHGMPRKKSTPEADDFKPLVDIHT